MDHYKSLEYARERLAACEDLRNRVLARDNSEAIQAFGSLETYDEVWYRPLVSHWRNEVEVRSKHNNE